MQTTTTPDDRSANQPMYELCAVGKITKYTEKYRRASASTSATIPFGQAAPLNYGLCFDKAGNVEHFIMSFQ